MGKTKQEPSDYDATMVNMAAPCHYSALWIRRHEENLTYISSQHTVHIAYTDRKKEQTSVKSNYLRK